MRDTLVAFTYANGTRTDWRPVSETPTSELIRHLGHLATGNITIAPDSPNNGKSPSAIRDRILIELRARELGLV